MKIRIESVTIWPGSATVLYVRGSTFGPPPSFSYELLDISPSDKIDEFVAAPNGERINGVSVKSLKSGSARMTSEQWTNWSSGGTEESDNAYILSCLLVNLGLVAHSP